MRMPMYCYSDVIICAYMVGKWVGGWVGGYVGGWVGLKSGNLCVRTK